ncbi:threonine/serine exporter family protein [Macrococcus lamae]|uniref:Threonine/serine exporter n=1 Tax=Macrococcus lamae TaxID=198484 RepID=A0A4R6BW42_9STAP|nr:threonine/serine exporter family protein [Macrococcus lamae]TDM12615.1 threonine/serine exporter [Macrococcus lamae]
MSHDILTLIFQVAFQFITSFFATLFFSILFNAPKRLLIPCGVVGAVGWVVYYFTMQTMTSVGASFLGAFCLGAMAHLMARYYKRPVIIFYVSGIIPLVPGGLAYDATKLMIIHDYTAALQKSFEAMMISGAIAFALIVVEIIFQSYFKLRRRVQIYRNPI